MPKKKYFLCLFLTCLSFFYYCGSSEGDEISTSYTEICPSFSLTSIFDKNGNRISESQVNEAKVSWCLLSLHKPSHLRFNGVGRYGNCTGTLIDTDYENGPAYILTNGHCVGAIAPATSYLPAKGNYYDSNQDSNKTMTFNYFNDADGSNYITKLTKIIRYASMDKTDMALIELESSLKELLDQGIKAYKISSSPPSLNSKVYVLGSPLTGIDDDNQGLRYDSCAVDSETAYLKEGDFTFSKSYRVACSVVGGNSGSPVFQESDQTIVGLMNTGVESSKETADDCSLGKPCEIDADDKILTNLNYNYFQSASHLSKCFTQFGVFDKEQKNCKADSPEAP